MTHYKFEKWARANLDVVWDTSPPELYARCPFKDNHKHGDRTPSFGINVEKGLYVCHGCHEKGNFQQLSAHLRSPLTKTHATASETLDAVNKMRRKTLHTEDVQVYPEAWLAQFCVSHQRIKYWRNKRNLSTETIEEWALGFDRSTSSATIPIRDFHGRVLGVIRRRTDSREGPRYVYPTGFKITQHLWGSWQAKGEETVAITEGSVDALACWDAHIPAIALLGSRISDHQVNLLQRMGAKRIVLMLDHDEAGIEAAKQVCSKVRGMIISIGTYKRQWRGKDPADLSFRQRRVMFRDATLLHKPK